MEDWREAVWRAVPAGATPERFAARRAFLLAHVRAGERVLDLGAGDGAFAAELRAAGCDVVAVDVAEEALRRARARVPGLDARRVDEGAPLPLGEAQGARPRGDRAGSLSRPEAADVEVHPGELGVRRRGVAGGRDGDLPAVVAQPARGVEQAQLGLARHVDGVDGEQVHAPGSVVMRRRMAP